MVTIECQDLYEDKGPNMRLVKLLSLQGQIDRSQTDRV